MFKFVAKYHFLIFAAAVLFSSCQVNESFKNQKYTRLHLREASTENTVIYDSSQSSDLTYPSVEWSSLTEHYWTSDYSENFRDDTLVKIKDQIVPEIKNAILQNTPILVTCASGRYLIKEPYYDSLTNLLCGVYTKEFNTINASHLEIDYSEAHCFEINKNCIQVKKIEAFKKPITILSTGITIVNTEQVISDCIDQGVTLYLVTPKGNYIVHEPALDTSRNVLTGSFEKKQTYVSTPHLCLVLEKNDLKQIDAGYIDLSTIDTLEDSSINNPETETAEGIRKKERNGSLGILFLLIGLFYILIGVSLGPEIKNESLRQLMYTFFFVGAGLFLSLAFVCLMLVLE